MPPKRKMTPARREPPKRQRTDYDDDNESTANSDLSTKSLTVITTEAPTYTITDALTEATTDAGTADSPREVMKSTKVRKLYIQKAGSKNATETKAKTREIAGREESKLPPENTDWPATMLQKYQPKKSIATCDQCKTKFTLCNQEPDGFLRCKHNGQAYTIMDTISQDTWVRRDGVPQDVAAADAQLLARLRVAVQERNLLRAEVARNPSLRETSQLRLNERLGQENERPERNLAAFIPQGGRNRQAAYAASQLTAAANPPKRAANKGNPTADDTGFWPSAYGPARSGNIGVSDTQSPISPSTQTPVTNDNPQPANTNGRLSECGSSPLEFASLDVRGPSTPSARMSAQPNNGRNAFATDQITRSRMIFAQTPAQPSFSENVQATVRNNFFRQVSAQPSSRRIAHATNQATLLGNPCTQVPSSLTYVHTEHEQYGLATLPEFARPDTIMCPEVAKDVVSGIPGQTRARELFPPEWKKYLYRKPEEDIESNDNADFDEVMWDE